MVTFLAFLVSPTYTYPYLGELEKTFLLSACRSANLRAILHDQATLEVVDELAKTFDTVIGGDRRGSRLSDLRNPSQHLQILGKRKLKELETKISSALLAQSTDPDSLTPRHLPDSNAYTYKKLVIRGTQFQTEDSLPADSHIFCEHQGIQHYGRIKSIFLPPGQEDTTTVLLAIQRYMPLSEEDTAKDPYRLWGFSGGELVYNRFLEDYLIIKPEQVIGHIAKTTLGHVLGITVECVHVLPLDQVSPAFFAVSSPAYGLAAQVRLRRTQSPFGGVWRCVMAMFGKPGLSIVYALGTHLYLVSGIHDLGAFFTKWRPPSINSRPSVLGGSTLALFHDHIHGILLLRPLDRIPRLKYFSSIRILSSREIPSTRGWDSPPGVHLRYRPPGSYLYSDGRCPNFVGLGPNRG